MPSLRNAGRADRPAPAAARVVARDHRRRARCAARTRRLRPWPGRGLGGGRETPAEGLAAGLGPAGCGPAGALRVHEAWRCRARRVAAVAALVDLDVEDRPPGPDAPR